jgi:hypothetical protein
MSTFSVENRTTRTSPRFVSTTASELEGDTEFERRLPPEILDELEEAPAKTYRFRESSPYLRPPPPRVPARSVRGMDRPSAAPKAQAQTVARPPSPPPRQPVSPPPVPPIVAKPARSPSRPGAGDWWWILALLVAIPILSSHLPQGRPQPWTEVRRALPVALRALPVTAETSTVSNTARWQSIRMPDGAIVATNYQGQLPNAGSLPATGRFLGETRTTSDGTTWIWMQRAGMSFPAWVDP